MKIIVVEDDVLLGKQLVDMLSHFYEVKWFVQGNDVNEEGDLYVIDVMLPDISGFDLCQRIRKQTHQPIVMLTALDVEEDIVYGFKQGATDYVTKPFSFKILNMRIRSLFHLSHHYMTQNIRCGDLTIDLDNKHVYKNHHIIKLRKIEFEILNLFIKNAGRICTRDYLIEYLYAFEDVEESTLTVHVSRLRKAIGKEYIETVYGYGYRWIKEIEAYDQ